MITIHFLFFMNRTRISLLRTVIILIGLGAIAFLLWQPLVEGRNATATLFEVYFQDPFLAFAYIASIPFFIGLYQLFKLVKFPEQRNLQIIRNCALITIPFIIIGVIWILQVESDDRPPIIALGTITTLLSIAAAVTAAVFEKKVR